MIQAPEAFTVSVEYSRNHTAFHVHTDGRQEPVARMQKDGGYDTRYPYRVYTGAGLDEFAGYVTPFAAMTAERAELGSVRHRERTLRPDDWTFTQHDLGVLTGLPEGGANKLRHGSPLRVVLDHAWGDALFSFKLRFSSAESAGFEFIRLAGVRARYRITVHDPRVSLLLILACVAQFNTYAASDPRKAAVDVTANPLKG
ncbi:hypothetical protein [Streptomyces chattanoogensis]|uniref:hypothetical protein n=1 Tax=Streptomyces chattanoogensis TaxID=66876 RepID=UPI0005D75A2F|nr:hypothetical protein T261_7190 [Streptomyces lydicus]